eukprot:TRINITY_DN10793_c0_g1_i1.p2 TRINITY_DN10793_c0_g1~~TRINITY_DN10793_c0_g1_i1.p2  ORF type:complete len:189 (-),score=59.45 TRINITY_DN10793_c0_g1_i1:1-567(-)
MCGLQSAEHPAGIYLATSDRLFGFGAVGKFCAVKLMVSLMVTQALLVRTALHLRWFTVPSHLQAEYSEYHSHHAHDVVATQFLARLVLAEMLCMGPVFGMLFDPEELRMLQAWQSAEESEQQLCQVLGLCCSYHDIFICYPLELSSARAKTFTECTEHHSLLKNNRFWSDDVVGKVDSNLLGDEELVL